MMRALLTFLFVLLLAWRVDAAVVNTPSILVLSPEMSSVVISNAFWNAPNNSELMLAPGVYPTPLLGSHPDATACSLILPNKTNLTIRMYGAKLTNSNVGVAGHMLMISNFSNVKILGGLFDGGGIVDTNAGFPSLIVLDRVGSGFTLRDATLTKSVKAVKAWTNNPTFADLSYLNNHFVGLGDTNFPGAGGVSQDGSCIEAWGHRCKAIGNLFENYWTGVEIFNQPNETVFTQGTINDNHFKDSKGGCDILLLEGPGTPVTVMDLTIQNNTFTNSPGIRLDFSGLAVIKIEGMDVINAKITDNTASGSDAPDFIYVSPGSISSSIIAQNKVRKTRFNGIRLDSVSPCNNNIITANHLEDMPWRPIWVDGSGNNIYGNFIRNANTASIVFGAIYIWGGTSGVAATNNYIHGNFIRDDLVTPTTRGIELAATANWNILADNEQLRVTATTGFTDAGTGNQFRNNWQGTNFLARSSKVFDRAFTTNITGAVTIGAPQSTTILLTSSGANTLANPNINDGHYDQQRVTIRLEGANTVVFTDGQNVELSAATITLSDRDFLILVYDEADGVWYEETFKNNL